MGSRGWAVMAEFVVEGETEPALSPVDGMTRSLPTDYSGGAHAPVLFQRLPRSLTMRRFVPVGIDVKSTRSMHSRIM